MRLLVIRHADPDYKNNTITPPGHLEAKALAAKLARDGLDAIHCSPLGRARDTMRYTAEALSLEPVIEEWTQEVWNELLVEGTPWKSLAAWDHPGELYRADLEAARTSAWERMQYVSGAKARIDGTLSKIRDDSDAFLARLGYVRDGGSYLVERPSRKKIAVFCHGGFGLCWLSQLLEIPPALMWSGFWLAPSSVTTILFDERSEGRAVPRCIGLGDVSHLHEACLPVSTGGIKANFW